MYVINELVILKHKETTVDILACHSNDKNELSSVWISVESGSLPNVFSMTNFIF